MCLLFLIIGVLYVNRSRPYFTRVLCVDETWFLLESMFAHNLKTDCRPIVTLCLQFGLCDNDTLIVKINVIRLEFWLTYNDIYIIDRIV